jgi:hypothetical protein
VPVARFLLLLSESAAKARASFELRAVESGWPRIAARGSGARPCDGTEQRVCQSRPQSELGLEASSSEFEQAQREPSRPSVASSATPTPPSLFLSLGHLIPSRHIIKVSFAEQHTRHHRHQTHTTTETIRIADTDASRQQRQMRSIAFRHSQPAQPSVSHSSHLPHTHLEPSDSAFARRQARFSVIGAPRDNLRPAASAYTAVSITSIRRSFAPAIAGIP